jgi:hypothetical protein
MTSLQTDRTGTVNSSKAIKVPCRVATTADINALLSGGALGSGGGGLITIDGVTLAAGDRVLVKDQADARTNGIWVVQPTAWPRDVDFLRNNAVTQGTVVVIAQGTANKGLWFEVTTPDNPIVIGTSNITFAVTFSPVVSSAMSPVIGASTLVLARSDMGVPGLGDANSFTAPNTFGATVAMSGAAINEARTTIASAATTNIGGAAANYLQVTGTTTITAFDTVQAGTRRILEFAGALTLTNNSGIILPGGFNIATAAGDVAVMVSEGAGVWRCVSYTPAGFAPQTWSTGDVKVTLKTAADPGWVMMDDGTIGDASSGATTRANADTATLFALLWNSTVDADCSVSGGRGASTAADFAAHKTIALPKALGRALAVAGAGSGLTSRALAHVVGEEAHTMTIGELVSHTHPQDSRTYLNAVGPANNQGAAALATGGTTQATGSGTAFNVMQPTTFLKIMIKL